jgi:hypothetical protein
VCPVRCLLPEDFGPDDFDPDEEDDWVIEDEAPTAQISQTHYHYHAAPAALPEGEQSIVVVMQPKQLTGGKR